MSPPKTDNFQIIHADIFHMSAQNIHCGYSLEPPRRGVSTNTHNLCFNINKTNNVYPCKHQGPVVQSVVSLTSSLRVISLTVLGDSIYNILIFLAEKM